MKQLCIIFFLFFTGVAYSQLTEQNLKNCFYETRGVFTGQYGNPDESDTFNDTLWTAVWQDDIENKARGGELTLSLDFEHKTLNQFFIFRNPMPYADVLKLYKLNYPVFVGASTDEEDDKIYIYHLRDIDYGYQKEIVLIISKDICIGVIEKLLPNH